MRTAISSRLMRRRRTGRPDEYRGTAMRALVFSLSIGIGALGATSGVLAQHDGEPVSPSAARAAYSRFAGIYKLITTEGRGYLAYDPAGYVSETIQGPDQPSPAGLSGYAAHFGTFAV